MLSFSLRPWSVRHYRGGEGTTSNPYTTQCTLPKGTVASRLASAEGG